MLVKAAAGFHAYGFRSRDLYVIDVVIVPERLEQAVGETADQNVLHRLLAQVVIDPVNLLLAHDLEQTTIELHRTGQIGAEGLFDHDTTKPAFGFLQQT